MSEILLKNRLINLLEIKSIIKITKDPLRNDELQNEYRLLCSIILEGFSLPDTEKYQKLIEDSIAKGSNLCFDVLKKASDSYLLSSSWGAVQILENSRYDPVPQDAVSVLSQISITNHVYTRFVFNEIFIPRRESTINVFDALHIANYPTNLSLISMIALGKAGKNQERYLKHLKSEGVKYLDEFIEKCVPKKEHASTMSRLTEFWEILNHEIEFKELSYKFDRLARLLLNYISINIGGKQFAITECELYYYDEASHHADPYSHKAKEQLFSGRWYFNGFGLDITCGNYDKKIYGGILIRGIRTLDNTTFISGPSNVLKELYNQVGDVINSKDGIRIDEISPLPQEEQKPIQTKRVGLTLKKEDVGNFYEKPYRYISNIELKHKFQGKEKIVKELMSQNLINSEQAKEILGYNLKK